MVIGKHGFGYDIHEAKIWPDSYESLLAFIDLAPKYAKTLADIRDDIDPASHYARAEFLECLNFDKPELALAEVIKNVLAETNDLKLVTAIDYANSDNVILAIPEGDETLDIYNRKKVESAFKIALPFLQKHFAWPTFVTWQEEVPDKREFFVDTPLGKLRVWAKHPEGDCAEDYPGVYIDFVPIVDGKPEPEFKHIPLATVEYDTVDGVIQSCVYGDGRSDTPTEVVKHKNLDAQPEEEKTNYGE